MEVVSISKEVSDAISHNPRFHARSELPSSTTFRRKYPNGLFDIFYPLANTYNGINTRPSHSRNKRNEGNASTKITDASGEHAFVYVHDCLQNCKSREDINIPLPSLLCMKHCTNLARECNARHSISFNTLVRHLLPMMPLTDYRKSFMCRLLLLGLALRETNNLDLLAALDSNSPNKELTCLAVQHYAGLHHIGSIVAPLVRFGVLAPTSCILAKTAHNRMRRITQTRKETKDLLDSYARTGHMNDRMESNSIINLLRKYARNGVRYLPYSSYIDRKELPPHLVKYCNFYNLYKFVIPDDVPAITIKGERLSGKEGERQHVLLSPRKKSVKLSKERNNLDHFPLIKSRRISRQRGIEDRVQTFVRCLSSFCT